MAAPSEVERPNQPPKLDLDFDLLFNKEISGNEDSYISGSSQAATKKASHATSATRTSLRHKLEGDIKTHINKNGQ